MEIALNGGRARGRSGWFTPAEAEVTPIVPTMTKQGRVVVRVVSKRPSVPGPIYVELTPVDAAAVGQALQTASRQVLARRQMALPEVT